VHPPGIVGELFHEASREASFPAARAKSVAEGPESRGTAGIKGNGNARLTRKQRGGGQRPAATDDGSQSPEERGPDVAGGLFTDAFSDNTGPGYLCPYIAPRWDRAKARAAFESAGKTGSLP
jgi:hypothetical protein